MTMTLTAPVVLDETTSDTTVQMTDDALRGTYRRSLLRKKPDLVLGHNGKAFDANVTVKRPKRNIILSVIMIPLAAIAALPFYYLVVNTLKTQHEVTQSPLGLPSGIFLDNYLNVFQQTRVVPAFFNTVYVTALSIGLMLLIGAMAAFAVVVGGRKVATFMGFVLAIAFLIPPQTTLIHQFRMFANVGLTDSLNGLIVFYTVGSIFCYFLIVGYMKSIPKELFEAARVDGAGTLRIFFSVVMPLIRPILVTAGVFQTMWVWNDFLMPSIWISSANNHTLVLQVTTAIGQFATNWPMLLTLTVIVLIPIVVFFIFAQKHIVNGLLAGAVKG